MLNVVIRKDKIVIATSLLHFGLCYLLWLQRICEKLRQIKSFLGHNIIYRIDSRWWQRCCLLIWEARVWVMMMALNRILFSFRKQRCHTLIQNELSVWFVSYMSTGGGLKEYPVKIFKKDPPPSLKFSRCS